MPQDGSKDPTDNTHDELPLAINSLSYAYPGASPVISNFTLQLPRGSRCLLLGANGAGEISAPIPGLQTIFSLTLEVVLALIVDDYSVAVQAKAHFCKSWLVNTWLAQMWCASWGVQLFMMWYD